MQDVSQLTITARRYNLVSVTRRRIRAGSWYPAPAGPQSCPAVPRMSEAKSGVQGGYAVPRRSAAKSGAHFLPSFSLRSFSEAGRVQVLLSIMRVAPCPGEAERSRGYKLDRSHELITGYKTGWEHWRSVAVQIVSEPENCQVAGFWLRADARVRVQRLLRNCLWCRSKSKNCDELINYTVRVISSVMLVINPVRIYL